MGVRRVVVFAVWGVAWAAAACAQPASPPRSGGLVPRPPTSSPAPLRSSDALLRKWDANGDGRIDESEADVARSRMRRERTEIWQQSQAAESQLPAETAAEPDDAADGLVFPAWPPAQVKKQTDAGTKNAGTSPAGTKPKTSALNPREPAPPPKKDLNAGRLPAGLPAARGLPAGTPPAGWAGNGTTFPPQGGATTRPPVAPRAAAPRVSRPPTVPSRQRISAEEIGGP